MTNPAPAERLQRALEEYWPEGCPQFFIACNGHKFFAPGVGDGAWDLDTPHILIAPTREATAAAVAAAWFKAKRNAELRNNPEHIITTEWYRCNHAVAVYQSIHEAATEVA